MNIIKLTRHHFLLAAGCCLLSTYAQAALPLVEIKTYGQHIGGKVVYTHLVTNNSTCKIENFSIAEDTDYINSKLAYSKDWGELDEILPVGFEHYEGDGISGSYDPSSFSGPSYWHGDITRISDGGGSYLIWRHRDPTEPTAPAGQDISPGQTARFSVTVPKVDTVYVMGHFSAHLWGGNCPSRHNDKMQLLDTTPPVLSVTLTPATITAAQRGQMIPVTATITVKDDYDPAPEIKLVSVLADDPANGSDIQGDAVDTDDRSFSVRAARFNPAIARTYQVVYSATDASGNTSTATVNLLVN